MIQVVNQETINCELCGEEHPSSLIAFTKTLIYKEQKIPYYEYYHSCDNRRELYQTNTDINYTFIAERMAKKNYDAYLQSIGAQDG